MMIKKALAIITLLVLISSIILASCGVKAGPASANIKPSGTTTVRATWIEPEITGDSVAISLSEVKKDRIVHFKISTATNDESYMAYEYGGVQYVRADICPPCLSESFSLVKNTLVCDTCGTVFDAKTGAGISGACVRYPKAPVVYQVSGDKMVMTVSNLEAAFQTTLIPKKP